MFTNNLLCYTRNILSATIAKNVFPSQLPVSIKNGDSQKGKMRRVLGSELALTKSSLPLSTSGMSTRPVGALGQIPWLTKFCH